MAGAEVRALAIQTAVAQQAAHMLGNMRVVACSSLLLVL